MVLITDNNQEGLKITETYPKVHVKYEGCSAKDQHVALQATTEWKVEGTTVYYYEVSVISATNAVGVGLAVKDFPKVNVMPGWIPNTYAYHGDDGNRFKAGDAQRGWPLFGKDAVVGLGLRVATNEIFGTLNGKLLGEVATLSNKEILYPTIGFDSPAEIEIFFDKKDHKFDISTLPEHLSPTFAPVDDLNSPKALVLFTNGLDDEKRAQLEGQLKAISDQVKTTYGFRSYHTSETGGRAKGIRGFTGIHDRSPLVVAINLSDDQKYAIPEGEEITSERILKFMEDIKEGKETKLKRSAKRPDGDKHPDCPTLTQVVNSSFDELVIGGNKDVLLDVYADWCGPCKAIAPTIEILSQVFADHESIVIAKIDCDVNDIDRTYLPEKSIPNIKLFKGSDKKNPIKYEGNRSADHFLEFLHQHVDVKFDLEAAKAKAKELKVANEKKQLKQVVPVHSTEEFKTQIATDKLVITDYFATWCGPCRAIAPVYADLSEEFKDKVVFLKVDVDQLKEVAKEQNIECMPTFKAYRKGVEVGKLEGADAKALKKLITDNF